MRRLLIFLKYPTPGQVKTRLAAQLGDEAAAGIYRASVELTLHRLGALEADAVVCVDPPEALARTHEWLGSGWTLRPQQGATLGERLSDATRAVFADGATRLVIVGTDSPWLRVQDVELAFGHLDRTDVVLGPSQDGGYYLIGLSQCTIGLFEDIAWSSPLVFDQTRARVAELGLHAQVFPQGYDLDRVEDVQRFVAEESARGCASSMVDTIAALMNHRRSPCPS